MTGDHWTGVNLVWSKKSVIIFCRLLKQCPDPLLIHAGINNVSKKDLNAKTVADQIIDIARSATERGVKGVFISSIAIRKQFRLQKRANELNAILQSLAMRTFMILLITLLSH